MVTKEEMLGLVRAIKFAKPEASMRQVHIEITEQLSQNESFEFLSQIPLNDVKKVWKKAVQESSAKRQENTSGSSSNTGSTTSSGGIGNMLPEKNDKDEPWKLYTVGNGSVQSLATKYSQATAKAAMENQQQQQQQQRLEQREQSLLSDHFVHVFLNVPGDRSGRNPYQAIVNFNENNNSLGKSGKMGNNASKKSIAAAANDTIICKIQVAAASTDAQKFPMLLYNHDRTLKTFVHPSEDNDDDDDGYDRIFHMIKTQGVGGALGAIGGTKAYFHAKLTAQSGGNGEDILSIDTRQLADVQSW